MLYDASFATTTKEPVTLQKTSNMCVDYLRLLCVGLVIVAVVEGGRGRNLRSGSSERPLGWSYRRYWYKPRPYRPLFVGKRNQIESLVSEVQGLGDN